MVFKRKKALRITITTFLSFVAVAGILVAVTLAVLASFGVLRVVTTNTDSMSPAIFDGSLVFAQNVGTAGVPEGEVALLNTAEGSFTIGRVLTHETENGVHSYILKPDNRVLPDEWAYKVTGNSYQYLFSVPVLGYILTGLSNFAVSVVFVVFVLLLSVSWILFLHKRREQEDGMNVFEAALSKYTILEDEAAEKPTTLGGRLKAFFATRPNKKQINDNGADVLESIFVDLGESVPVLTKYSRAQRKNIKTETGEKVPRKWVKETNNESANASKEEVKR